MAFLRESINQVRDIVSRGIESENEEKKKKGWSDLTRTIKQIELFLTKDTKDGGLFLVDFCKAFSDSNDFDIKAIINSRLDMINIMDQLKAIIDAKTDGVIIENDLKAMENSMKTIEDRAKTLIKSGKLIESIKEKGLPSQILATIVAEMQ